MDLNSLVEAALFSPASLRSPSAWMGHLPLAAWVIREVVPGIFVELGTHTANSYFAFCQSVVEAGLATKCYAVDTWHGDEHAGQYDEEIFTEVNAHNEERYGGFSRLLRMTFDDALGCFSDASIDLLHIDGLHTYEAVRHDFETWLPKLAPGAIVMFHDTGVRELNFGVWKLWEELRAQYPNNIEFAHSHGLGILQLNNAPDVRRQKWLQLDVSEKERLTTYFAALGARQVERFELTSELSKSRQKVLAIETQIENVSRALAERDVQIAALRQHASNLDDLGQHTSNLEKELFWRDTHIANLGRAVDERDVQIEHLRQHVSNLDARIVELTQHAANLDAVIVDLEQRASSLDHELSARDTAIIGLRQALATRDELIAALGRDVNALLHSTSWRITAPLRWISQRLKWASH